MNVLLTSVGRRAYMVKYFKEAVGEAGQVHVCNSDSRTVAFHYADKAVVSPLIYDEDYIPFLLKYCRENQIGILVSLFDIDLLVLAKNKHRFAQIGTKVIVSDADYIEICNDKWKTYEFLRAHGFHAPKSYLTLESVCKALENGEVQFPIVVKPRFGCGSIAVEIAYDEEDLRYLYKKGMREIQRSYLRFESEMAEQKLIFQQCLQGQEYGADIINDLQANPCAVILRKKLAMRSGETDAAQIVKMPAIEQELTRLSTVTGHIGNVDCDIFLVEGVPYILEMNARFGGGYPFSHMGGCDLPRAIVAWCEGKTADPMLLEARADVTGYKELYITQV